MGETKKQEPANEGGQFDDGFDENLLRQIQEQFYREAATDSANAETETGPLQRGEGAGNKPDSDKRESVKAEEFLEFEEFTRSLEQEVTPREIELDPSFSVPPDGGQAIPDVEEPVRAKFMFPRLRGKALVITGSLGIIALLAAGWLALSLFTSNDQAPPAPGLLRHPIPLRFFSEKQQYFFLAQSGESRKFLNLELELTFEGEEARHFLKERRVELRDLIYRFLVEQKPAKNSFSQWQAILDDPLLKTIRMKLPGCNLQELSITSLEWI